MTDQPRTLLALLVSQSDKAHEEHVRALQGMARHMREDATFSLRQFERWLAGGVERPRAAARRVLGAYYRHSADALFGPPPVQDPERYSPEADHRVGGTLHGVEGLIMSAAHESSEHASWISSQVQDSSIIDLQQRVAGAARRYAATPPLQMFGELKRIRDQAFRVIEQTRRPSQQEDLLLVAGQACALLAGITYDLGYPDAAAEHARAAFTYSRVVDHPSLAAFSLALQSTIAFWSGEPRRGVQLALTGLDHCQTGAVAVRLFGVQARSWALLGVEDEAGRSLAAAERAREDAGHDDLIEGIGGEFGFNPARLALCSAAAYVALEDGATAARYARRAIDLYAELPEHERWIGGEFGARLDLVAALVIGGDISGAVEEMEPVLALESQQRTERLAQRVRALRSAVTRGSARGTADSARLGGMIEHFVADTAVRALPTQAPLSS